MQLRHYVIGTLASLALALLGCDSGGDLKEGMPSEADQQKKFDVSKAIIPMDPNDQKKAMQSRGGGGTSGIPGIPAPSGAPTPPAK
jgi:hypothetical protein